MELNESSICIRVHNSIETVASLGVEKLTSEAQGCRRKKEACKVAVSTESVEPHICSR